MVNTMEVPEKDLKKLKEEIKTPLVKTFQTALLRVTKLKDKRPHSIQQKLRNFKTTDEINVKLSFHTYTKTRRTINNQAYARSFKPRGKFIIFISLKVSDKSNRLKQSWQFIALTRRHSRKQLV